MTTSFSLRTLSRDDILHDLPALSEILASCVNGGASVSFMLPFSLETATAFWLRMAQSVAAGERIVLAAADAQQRLVGTVQLITDQPENQPHRADVAKLLVHQNARRQGLANALMERRISVSTAEPFCVSATIPQALRIALGSVPFDSLRPALLSVRDAVEYEQYR